MLKRKLIKCVLTLSLSLMLTSCSEKPSNWEKDFKVNNNQEITINDNAINHEKEKEKEIKHEDESLSKNFQKATVVRVVDGDTIVANVDGEEYKIRLIGVNTPETVHPSKPVEYYGKEASEFTKSVLTEGKEIYLEKDVSDVDRYGRMLRYVWLQVPKNQLNPSDSDIDNNMFNALLLKGGYAQVSTFPPDVNYQEHFLELEKTAKKEKNGLWSENIGNDEVTNKVSSEGKIKGNKNSMIYHIPGGKYYDSISDKNLIYFDSEDDAISAGYRKSKK